MAKREYTPAPGDYSRNPKERERMEAARAAQRALEHPLTVAVSRKEVDIPDGGGKGVEVPYSLTVAIEGRPALQLLRHHFKEAGQMERFIELVQALEPITQPNPK